MSGVVKSFDSVAVSTRIRLARNFKDYPFPARLINDKHADEQSREMTHILTEALCAYDAFDLYEMDSISDETAARLIERNLISRDLLKHRRIAAALVNEDKNIAVMINEEDHLREQCFMKGFELKRAYERMQGIDEIIAGLVPLAFDSRFGYLTACPSNLGTGMRASVMLFLPALSRRGVISGIVEKLKRQGLVIRGSLGEGSGAKGEMFQVSNEETLGRSESEILELVGKKVKVVVGMEIDERERMKIEEGVFLEDKIMRSLGILSNCRTVSEKEFSDLTADIKLGLALGYFEGVEGSETDCMAAIDDVVVETRPANLNHVNGSPLTQQEQNITRASLARKQIPSIVSA